MTSGVTIGQAAAFAGVTVKTVRHYHRLGLVAEPERDASGYRRYGSSSLLRLMRVRTLAEAGVPLAEVGRLLDADDDEFAASLVDVERDLTARIEELIARRDTLHRLADGDRALLPDRATALLDRLVELGLRPDEVDEAQEGMILAKALVPEAFDEHLAHVENALDDPDFVAFHQRTKEAVAWAADDPRIPAFAVELADHYLADPARLNIVTGMQARSDTAARYRAVRDFGIDQDTAGQRIVGLVEARLRDAGVRIPSMDD